MSPIKLSILLLSFALLSGCGFKPVYGKGENADSNPALSAIYIEQVEGRDGQVLTNKLQDLLNPNNQYSEPAYTLKINLKKDRREFGIQEDLRITRYDIHMIANYELIDKKTNQLIFKDSSTIYSGFNRTTSEFSTFVGEENASEKAAEQLAQEIKAKLAAYFE